MSMIIKFDEQAQIDSVQGALALRPQIEEIVNNICAEGYKTVTLIDIREIPSPNLKVLAKYIGLDFANKDVLMLYSTTVLNAGTELK